MRKITVLLFAIALAFSQSTASEAEHKTPAPQVLSIAMPYYPVVARASKVEGVVRIEITTDGQSVKSTRVAEGNKLLAKFAEANAETWTFVKHDPMTFVVTYDYKLVTHVEGDKGYGEVVLHPPDHVEVSAMTVVVSDRAH